MKSWIGFTFSLLFLAGLAKASAAPHASTGDRDAVVRSIVQHFYVKGVPGFPVPQVPRVAIAGNFAIAMVRTEIEGSRYYGEFLLERFPFGWQTLEIATDSRTALRTCDLAAHDIAPHIVRLLSARIGIAYAKNGAYCPAQGTLADRGAKKSVLAIRKAPHPGIVEETVRAVGNWGLLSWYGGGGGEAIYKRTNAHWVEISGGGGSACPRDLVDLYHMPLSTARILLQGFDSGCK